MRKIFSDKAWKDYLYWQENDRKTLKRINKILKDIDRNPFEGIGKPELLKSDLSGYWSRRVNDADRLVYKIDGDILEIYQCRGHYDD